jgi:carboxypeptidase T
MLRRPDPRARPRALAGPIAVALAVALLTGLPATALAADEFPAGYEGYHTIAEANAEVSARVQAHPDIARRQVIGRSYEGRNIWLVKVSDNVNLDENEPEVLFDGLHHAREHMALEMTLAILRWLVEGYGSDDEVTRLVKTREIWIVIAVNPDGAVYDISGGKFHLWRKNRQPNAGSSYVGTDLNRNYSYRWGCCGGSDTVPGSNLYRGAKAFSAPETRVMRDFVESRVVGGRQQIRTAITFHTSGRLVMWPYGYTYTDLPTDMTRVDHETFVAIGRRMAASNGYKPEQASDLYITSGTFRDWLYGTQRIFSYTFELTVGWYADDSTIGSETGRNRRAVLHLIGRAGCPYAAIGAQEMYCGPFYDDLEIGRGWKVDPYGTDTATRGAWARGIPQATSSAGAKQLGSAASGRGVLATGLAAGSSANANDVDGGLTTIRSPRIDLATGATPRVRFRYSFAHDARSSWKDFLELRIISATQDVLLFRERGAPEDDDGRWSTRTVAIPASFAGQSVRLVFQAGDRGPDSLVEAMIDDVAVMRP